ncbi:MAG: nickel pincer cofactor biosynthesis protein LarC [Actinomycetota bacterium]
MRLLYFDCIAGISGDMALGALIDAGADLEPIRKGLEGLPVESFELDVEQVESGGIRATKVNVRTSTDGLIRTYASVRSLLDMAEMPLDAKAMAQRIFRRLAEAEAMVHRRDLDQVTFHEVGAVDSIVDIVGTSLALASLKVDRVFASAVPTGMGMVKTEHGLLPIPAPAVMELLRGAPIYSRNVSVELVTPTGAAILAALVEGFGEIPHMRIEHVGYGAGTARLDFPNVVRVVVGEADPSATAAADTVSGSELVLETNVDDLNPELYAYVLERLFAAGAQDAWLTPIVMKKGRPAVTISVLASPSREEAIRQVLFRETGTLGIRSSVVDKQALEREWVEVATRNGSVRVKIGRLEGNTVTVAPEFEDCVKVAREAGVPAREVYEEATRLAREAIGE